MVFEVDLADAQDVLHRFFVAEMAAERVAGIGGVNDDAAFADDFDGLFDQALLGVFGVDGEKLCHAESLLWRVCG